MKEEEYKEALASNERKWEFRYEQQWRKQKELEEKQKNQASTLIQTSYRTYKIKKPHELFHLSAQGFLKDVHICNLSLLFCLLILFHNYCLNMLFGFYCSKH